MSKSAKPQTRKSDWGPCISVYKHLTSSRFNSHATMRKQHPHTRNTKRFPLSAIQTFHPSQNLCGQPTNLNSPRKRERGEGRGGAKRCGHCWHLHGLLTVRWQRARERGGASPGNTASPVTHGFKSCGAASSGSSGSSGAEPSRAAKLN